MAIEVVKAYENSTALTVYRNGKELVRAQITNPSDGEAPALLVVWETDKSVQGILDQVREVHLELDRKYQSPRELLTPPRYLQPGNESPAPILGYGEIPAPYSGDGNIVYDLDEILERKIGTPAGEHTRREKKTISWVRVTTPFFSIYMDGEYQPDRLICLQALESMPNAVTSIVVNTAKTNGLFVHEREQITEAFERSWGNLPVLTPKE